MSNSYNPMDCSQPGSSVHGISQARILLLVAITFSRGSFLIQGSNPHLLHWQADSLPLSHQRSPCLGFRWTQINLDLMNVWMLLGYREDHHLQSIGNHSTEVGWSGEGPGEWAVLTSASIQEFVFLYVSLYQFYFSLLFKDPFCKP